MRQAPGDDPVGGPTPDRCRRDDSGTGSRRARARRAGPGGSRSDAAAGDRGSQELRAIFFDFDKHTIRPDAARTLDANVNWLKSHPSALLLIEGHCDERGTNAYNLVLGERRAKATQEYLVSRGVEAARITIISYGEERPSCNAHNEACWAQNRRANFLTK